MSLHTSRCIEFYGDIADTKVGGYRKSTGKIAEFTRYGQIQEYPRNTITIFPHLHPHPFHHM